MGSRHRICVRRPSNERLCLSSNVNSSIGDDSTRKKGLTSLEMTPRGCCCDEGGNEKYFELPTGDLLVVGDPLFVRPKAPDPGAKIE